MTHKYFLNENNQQDQSLDKIPLSHLKIHRKPKKQLIWTIQSHKYLYMNLWFIFLFISWIVFLIVIKYWNFSQTLHLHRPSACEICLLNWILNSSFLYYNGLFSLAHRYCVAIQGTAEVITSVMLVSTETMTENQLKILDTRRTDVPMSNLQHVTILNMVIWHASSMMLIEDIFNEWEHFLH